MGTDRSIMNGISFPQWMKGKVDNRFDFDEGAFSPPSHDDNFFCIRYSKSKNLQQQPPSTSSAVLSEINKPSASSSTPAVSLPSTINFNKSTTSVEIKKSNTEQIDYSKHPVACQPFISTDKKGTFIVNKPVNKSQGVDDGFHSTPALCGKSIVHVATKIMSEALVNKKLDNSNSGNKFESDKMDELKKGSQSLPVTPTASPFVTPDSSPRTNRRGVNRFFNGGFNPDRDKHQGGWILTSILRQSREFNNHKIEEEDETAGELAPNKPLSRKKSISTQNLTYLGTDNKGFTDKVKLNEHSGFQVQASELREMNFWSPTSM